MEYNQEDPPGLATVLLRVCEILYMWMTLDTGQHSSDSALWELARELAPPSLTGFTGVGGGSAEEVAEIGGSHAEISHEPGHVAENSAILRQALATMFSKAQTTFDRMAVESTGIELERSETISRMADELTGLIRYLRAREEGRESVNGNVSGQAHVDGCGQSDR